jgi:hypothetical protein
VAEGLSTAEVGKEIGAHAKHAGHGGALVITEAVVLSVVAVLAAWSGFAAAKWSTESSIELAHASALHTQANRFFQQALIYRVGDATTFNAWFGAYVAGDEHAAAVAVRRFRPEYRVAFDAWLGTHPFTNANAPAGPQSMPQYVARGEAHSAQLDNKAEAAFAHGEHAGSTADDYVRTAVILASVLFLIGISSHFPVRGARIGLIVVGVALLGYAFVHILSLPGPPA